MENKIQTMIKLTLQKLNKGEEQGTLKRCRVCHGGSVRWRGFGHATKGRCTHCTMRWTMEESEYIITETENIVVETEKIATIKLGGFFNNPPHNCPCVQTVQQQRFADLCTCEFNCPINGCSNYLNYRKHNFTHVSKGNR